MRRLRKEFGSVVDAVVSIIRTVFCAPEGSRLLIVDLNAIEARMVGWLAGCEAMLDAFRAGQDIYKDFAAEVMGVAVEQLPDGYRNKFGKPGILGSGYGQGPGAQVVDGKSGQLIKTGMWGFAERQGIKLTQEEAQKIVTTYRQKYPEVPQLWRDYEEAMHWCMETGATVEMHKVLLRRASTTKPTIQVELPSRRCIHYVNCRMGTKTRDDGQEQCVAVASYPLRRRKPEDPQVGGYRHLGRQADGRISIKRFRAMFSLAACLLPIAGVFELVAHCHDEVICWMTYDSPLGEKELKDCMITPPDWAPDLPLAAEVESSPFYKK